MTKDSLLKEGGQAAIVIKGKKSIAKVFKSTKTFQRENSIQLNFIQPLNKFFKKKPFAEAYPKKSTHDLKKKEFKMKKYDGDLQNYINNNQLLSEDEVRALFVKIIYPVLILHRYNIYHGDLKPDNYLYKMCKKTKEIQLYLTDFGGAEILSSRDIQIHTPYCYSKSFHPIDLLNQNHGYFNPFSADCYMLGVILSKISCHLQEVSLDLKILQSHLLYYQIQIEQVMQFAWINNNKVAKEQILKLSKANQEYQIQNKTEINNSLSSNCNQQFLIPPQSQNLCYQSIQYPYQYFTYNPQYLDQRYYSYLHINSQPYVNSFLFNNQKFPSQQSSLSFCY